MRTEQNVTTVDELVGLLNQEDQKQTHRYMSDIQRDWSNSVASYKLFTEILVRSVSFVYQHACCLLSLVLLTFIFHKVM